MTKTVIAIPAAVAIRTLPAISDEETRFYLQGLSIEPAPTGSGCYVVATDGCIMAAEFCPGGSIAGEKIIVRFSKDILKHLKEAKRDTFPRWAVVTRDEVGKARGAVVFATSASEALSAAKSNEPGLVIAQWLGADIDGSFPDWRRVVPAEDKMANGVKVDGVNPALIARLTAGAKVVTFWTTGDSGDPQLITRTDAEHWLGVFMPMRGGCELPTWFRPSVPTKAPKSEKAA